MLNTCLPSSSHILITVKVVSQRQFVHHACMVVQLTQHTHIYKCMYLHKQNAGIILSIFRTKEMIFNNMLIETIQISLEN